MRHSQGYYQTLPVKFSTPQCKDPFLENKMDLLKQETFFCALGNKFIDYSLRRHQFKHFWVMYFLNY